MHWQPSDPGWLVTLAREQEPSEPWLAESLARCTLCMLESDAYIYFVDPSRPNKPGSEWQIRENIILDDPTRGSVVLDVLQDNRVGGIEFLSKVL
jgi:hypothetical protein